MSDEARSHTRSRRGGEVDSGAATGRNHKSPSYRVGQDLLAAGSCSNQPRSMDCSAAEAHPRRRWIMDGDLGPYDAVEVRLQAADTIIFLDFSLVRCVWRALRRSRERADFWRWLLVYRRKSRPLLLAAIARHAPNANLHVLCNPNAVRKFLAEIARESGSQDDGLL